MALALALKLMAVELMLLDATQTAQQVIIIVIILKRQQQPLFVMFITAHHAAVMRNRLVTHWFVNMADIVQEASNPDLPILAAE